MLDSDDFIIHPNKYIQHETKSSKTKHFIFDLDETLGSFAELYLLWRGVNYILASENIHFEGDQNDFNKLLDLFPEFLRYGILTILEFLHYKKRDGSCGNIFIYTNNQCQPPWVELIANYIESKKRMTGLFQRPICAFKIKNTVFEPNRSTQEKTVRDFIKCSLLPKSAELCFIDNAYHPKMDTGSVFYIQPRSYYHSLSLREIIDRFSKSGIFTSSLTPASWTDHLKKWFHDHVESQKKTQEDEEIDIAVSRKLMYTIKEFFYFTLKRGKTKRNVSFGKKSTRKHRATI